MSTGRNKGETITFKVDESLSEAMQGIRNRSEFIRSAVLTALGNVCPLCSGSGTLSAAQRLHWDDFAHHHRLQTCEDCRETRIICDHEGIAHQ